ncbi:MAG: radical SAM protein [Coriobacteriales bacterium]|jgi:pyruvate formate lyase activating enzyme|nr:radical SAM protein [Coriobacteriales bacterium]
MTSTLPICPLCPHACVVDVDKTGRCGARHSPTGITVTAANYGHVTSLALDPIEKKPLARFHPGSKVLSVGSYGCNLNCPFCQNSSIARLRARDVCDRKLTGGVSLVNPNVRDGGLTKLTRETPPVNFLPEQLAAYALQTVNHGNVGVAYTYNEPLVGYEYVLDCARLVHEANLLNVIVTNGYINEQPWLELLPHLDAANIDLKGFTQTFYDRVDAPRGLETVKRSIALAATRIHVEVTTLIVPGLNDVSEEIDALAAWLASIDPAIPLHLTRFFPAHRMSNAAPTPRQTILDLVDVAKTHLHNVIPGNM